MGVHVEGVGPGRRGASPRGHGRRGRMTSVCVTWAHLSGSGGRCGLGRGLLLLLLGLAQLGLAADSPFFCSAFSFFLFYFISLIQLIYISCSKYPKDLKPICIFL